MSGVSNLTSIKSWTILGLLASVSVVYPEQAHAVSYSGTPLDQMIEHTSAIALVTIHGVNPEAGNEATGPQTEVHVEVLDLYWGELPGEFTFFLPEGSLPWVQEDVLFRDLAGLPKPVPGETALVFFRSGNWLVTPFTHGESGYWRVVQVDGEQYLANDQGRCLDRVDPTGPFFLDSHPVIFEASQYLGPIFDGQRRFWSIASDTDIHGPEDEPDDEVAGVWEPNTFEQIAFASENAAHCVPFDNFIDEIIGYFGAHEPLGPFIEFTSMDAGRFLPLEMGESDPAEDDYVCFEDELPLSCEL